MKKVKLGRDFHFLKLSFARLMPAVWAPVMDCLHVLCFLPLVNFPLSSKFLIPGFFWAGKFGKYFLGCLI